MNRAYRKLKEIFPDHIRVVDRMSRWAAHYIYTPETLESIKVTQREPQTFRDKLALQAIRNIRKVFDWGTRYDCKNMTENKWINRCIFLETVAGVPGMVGGMARHLRSLRFLVRDKGRIHHLLEEADNERFHLFIFLNLKRPGFLFRTYIILAQMAFFGSFMATYLIAPKYCHRFVGYLEEEAVRTYTEMLKHMENGGCLSGWWTLPAPKHAIQYYSLPENANFRDVILAIRADEACHRELNHYFGDVDNEFQLEFEQTFIQEDVEGPIKKKYEEKKEKELKQRGIVEDSSKCAESTEKHEPKQ